MHVSYLAPKAGTILDYQRGSGLYLGSNLSRYLPSRSLVGQHDPQDPCAHYLVRPWRVMIG